MAARREAQATVINMLSNIDKFDPTKESFKRWRQEFDEYMEAIEEPEEGKLKLLKLCLPRSVKDYINELNDDDLNFKTVCERLESKYNENAFIHTAIAKWRNLRWKNDIDGLVKEIKELHGLGWPSRKGEEKRTDMINKLCDLAPRHIQIALDEYGGSIDAAAEKIKRLGLLDRERHQGKDKLDKAKNDKFNGNCFTCGKAGHKSSSCKSRSTGGVPIVTKPSPPATNDEIKLIDNRERRAWSKANNVSAQDSQYLANVTEIFKVDDQSILLPMLSKKNGITNKLVVDDSKKKLDCTNVLPIIEVKIGETLTNALLDSGANTNIISYEFVVNKGFPILPDESTVRSTFGDFNQSHGKTSVTVNINNNSYVLECQVFPESLIDPAYQLLIGTPGITKFGDVTFNLSSNTVCVNGHEIEIKGKNSYKSANSLIIEPSKSDLNIEAELIKRFPEFKSMCSQSKVDIGKCSITVPKQKYLSEFPHQFKRFNWSNHLKPLARQLISELKQSNVIKRSNTQFLHNLICVKKPGGEGYRATLDLRKTNSVTVPWRYPCANIKNMLEDLHEYCYFSKIDLVSCYHQFVLHPDDCHRFGLYTEEEGVFEFTRLPQGFVNSSSIVAQIMDKVTGSMKDKVRFYADDGLIYSKLDENHHLDVVSDVLKQLHKYGLKISLSKSTFLSQSVRFLGYCVTPKGLEVDKTSALAISKIQEPSNIRQLRSFLGCLAFFQCFIICYAKLLNPLYKLLEKNTVFKFGEVERRAFVEAKQRLLESPTLGHLNPNLPVHIFSDASQCAYGACMTQLVEMNNKNDYANSKNDDENDEDNKQEKKLTYVPILFWSKTRPHKIKTRSSTHLELHAITLFFRSQRARLIGMEIIIHCDNKPVVSMLNGNNHSELTPMIESWLAELTEYNVKAVYFPGSLNKVADLLSRSCDANVINNISQLYGTKERNMVGEFNLREIQAKDDLINNYKLEEFQGLKGKNINVDGKITWVPYLPKDRFEIVASKIHQSGHFNHQKLLRILRLRWYNPLQNQIVMSIVKKCAPCQYRNLTYAKKGGEKIIGYTEPRICYYLDLGGPYQSNLSKAGNKYILLMVDACSRFLMGMPIKDCSCVSVAEGVATLIHRFGKPLVIRSDCAAYYTQEFSDLCMAMGIHHQKGTPHIHSSSTIVERAFRTVESMISKFVNDVNTPAHLKEWDAILEYCCYNYNITPHDTGEFSPFHIFFGSQPNLVTDIKLVMPCSIDKNVELDELLFKIQCAYSENFNNMINKRLSVKHTYPSHETQKYEKNELILVKRVNPKNKFEFLYKGPYIIVSSDEYRVCYKKKPNSRGRPYVAHKSMVKKYSYNDNTSIDEHPRSQENSGEQISEE